MQKPPLDSSYIDAQDASVKQEAKALSPAGSRGSTLLTHRDDREETKDCHPKIALFPSLVTKLRTSTFLVGLALLGGVGCGGEDGAPPGLDSVGGGQYPASGPCEEGVVRSCSRTLDQANGKLTCYHGIERCEDGVFGPCAEGETSIEIDPRSEQHRDFFVRRGMAYSMATECTNNACDPSCMNFIEDPTDIGTGGTTGGDGDLPEIDSCEHSLCDEGAGLADDCDACVTTICAVEAGCCDESDPAAWDSTCTELVAPLCANESPPVSLCDFSLFAESNVDLFTGSDIVGGTIGAAGTLDILNVTTTETLLTTGAIYLDGGSYTGSIYSGSTVTLSGGATNDPGKTHEGLTTSVPAIPTRTFTCLPSSGVTIPVGATTVTVNPLNANTYNITSPSSVVILNGPGDYGSITFSAAGTLVFAGAGTYTFNNFNITTGAPTLLFPPDEDVNIETCSGLNLQNGATVREYTATTNSCGSLPAWASSPPWWYGVGTQVLSGGNYYTVTNGHGPAASNQPGVGASWASYWTNNGVCVPVTYSNSGSTVEPFSIQWYTNSTGTTLVGPGALGGGVLIAPSATVQGQTGSNTGLIFAEFINTQTNFDLDATGLTGAACEALGLATPVTSTCAVDIMPPLLNEPCSTGLDCQVNHRCTEPESGSCSHSKCAPGAALDSSCDECVERICAVDSSCCTDSWTTDCVDQVATVCDAVCDDYSCLHQPCSETGAPLEPSCDPCIATVCATSGYEDCCTDFWSFACELEFRATCGVDIVVTDPTDGGSICDYSTYGRYELQAYDTTLIGGWVGSPSSASQNIAFSDIYGDATSSGSLNAFGSTVYGDLLSGSGSIAFGTVTGMVITGVPPTPAVPDKVLTGCSAFADPRSGTIAPGTYGDVTVADGDTLTLTEGTYQFNSLTLGVGSELALPSNGAIVTINVCEDVDFENDAYMSGLTAATAMNVSIYAEGYIAAHGNNTLYGLLLAVGNPGLFSGPCTSGDPCDLSALRDGYVYIGQNCDVYGIVAGERRVDVRGGSTIDATGLEEMCELNWNPGSVMIERPDCPMVTSDLPTGSGTCEENLTGYEDATCGGYDLALGIPCEDEVPVCNHGTTQFSGTVEVGYWDAADMQLSTDSPTAPGGTCSDSLTIDPGTCETLVCGSLPATDQTMMVDPTGSMSECDDRRLDNWTYFDGRMCGSSVATFTEVQVYEAVCPDDSAPRWGLLTWSTSTPGTSTITFSATTAPTVADLATAPAPTVLGVAETGRELCTRSGPGPECPVDITDLMSLGNNQDPVLQLTMELSGSDSPVLEDWIITYSCVVDQ